MYDWNMQCLQSWKHIRVGSTAVGIQEKRETAQTYSVQMHVDLTASIDSGLFASELCDLAQDADCAVSELFQVGGVDARSLFGHYVC